MNEFDNTVNEYLDMIDENSFKSLATAGLLGMSALGATPDAQAVQPTSMTDRVSDQSIIEKTVPVTAWAEGFRERVYNDSKNIPSIGYGFNLKEPHIRRALESKGYSSNSLISGNQSISKQDADDLLKLELNRALVDAKKLVKNWESLEPSAKIVILDMSYNLGYNRLSKFVKFRTALENYDYSRAKAEMIDSKWYSDVGRRSKYLVKLMDQALKR